MPSDYPPEEPRSDPEDELDELQPRQPGRTASLDIPVDVVSNPEASGSRSRPGRRPASDPGRAVRTGPGRAVRTTAKRGRTGANTGPRRTGADTDPNIGRILGSYKLHSLLGSGGMGQVYLAEHVILGRKVALKLLRPEYAVKRDAVHRFFQEARAVNTIGHENIVDITDFVELDTGETFFIMELLIGQDLAELLRRHQKPLPLHTAMRIAMQVCDGLEAAHNASIVHRDLKPDNIFILETTKPNFVKLLDFGVAKLQGFENSNASWQTAAGSVIGTPAYMSPEQASGIPVDNRSDIYSLGAILYELFTGHPVFRARSFGEYVVKHMNDIPVPPRDLPNAPRIPLALEEVILRCLEKDPKERYQSVADLRADLARATATVETSTRMPLPPRRRSPWLKLVLIPAFLALAGVAFGFASGIFSGKNADDHLAPPTPLTKTAPPPAKQIPVQLPAVEPVPPQAAPQAVPLAPRTAQVTLITDPPGAEVYRAGSARSIGNTPLARHENVGDEVEFTFRMRGYQPQTERVQVTDNTVLTVPLERRVERRKPVRVRKVKRPTPPRRGRDAKGSRKTGPHQIRPDDQVDPFGGQ